MQRIKEKNIYIEHQHIKKENQWHKADQQPQHANR